MSAALIGKVVNGYEILNQVGQGGMATVFLARQRSMNRNAALKFLPGVFMNDDTYLQRFEREVKIVAQLEHRNIVPVYDYGEFEGQPYIAMRYMPAGSVEDLLIKGRIPLERVASIIEQVASALDYAHQKGILHRDLKPSNILLDDGGGAFITDFGIARILGEGNSNITTQGVIGTPSYMSPEQAQGEPLDGRSDVYSLGVMLFELVTGRRPFISDTPYSIAVMHVTTPPPSPREFEPNVPPALESVILRSLRKTAADRYHSAGELAGALRKALQTDDSATNSNADFAPISAEVKPTSDTVGSSLPYSGTERATEPSTPRAVKLPFLSRRIPAKGGNNKIWIGVAAGSLIGCVLLTFFLVLLLLLLGLLSSEPTDINGSGVMATSSANAAPTLQDDGAASRSPLQATQVMLNAAADATFTADALLYQAQPTATSAGISPVGVRDRPTLNPALQAVEGELVYFAKQDLDAAEPLFEIVTLNLESWQTRRFSVNGSNSSYPLASPDGRWIAFQSDHDGDFEIYLINRLGGQLRQLTRNEVWDRLAAWSPDGQWIIYSSDLRGDQTFDLYQMRPDGREAQPLYSDGWRNSHARFSADGDYLVFTAGPDLRDARTWEIRLLERQSGETTLLTQNEVRDASPTFSPDNQRILYVTVIDGARALASMNIAGEDREILFTGPGKVWAANYSPDGQFIVVTATYNGEDQLFLMDAQGGNLQQITTNGGAYASWIPPVVPQ